jgi:two-component system, LytTR family, sensor kinase
MRSAWLSAYRAMQLTCWLGYAGASVLAFLPSTTLAMMPRLLLIKGTRATIGLLVSHVLYLLYRALLRRRATTVTFALLAVACCVVGGVVWWLAASTTFALLDGTRITPDWRRVPHRSVELIVALAGWTAGYVAWRQWRRAESADALAASADRQATAAQLDALRAQVNPHFLFNALTSVRACVLDDPERAREMITHLSLLLRRSLEIGSDRLVPLSGELDLVEAYFAIERVRFDDRVQFTIDASDEVRAERVPPFLLHPLVENAVTHGRSVDGAMSVHVRAERTEEAVVITVVNSGSVSPDAHRPIGMTGVGLRNVQQRLAHLSPVGSHVLLTESDNSVHVELRIARDIATADVA